MALFTFLWTPAGALPVTFQLAPPDVTARVFLVSTDPARPGCGSNAPVHALSCSPAPGAYTLSIYPGPTYGAVVDRPVRITRAETRTMALRPVLAGGSSVAEDWNNYTYKVRSTCATDVTYNDRRTTQQAYRVRDGWTEQTPKGSFAYLSAQLICTGGTVTAYILLGDRVLKQATVHGDSALVRVSYP